MRVFSCRKKDLVVPYRRYKLNQDFFFQMETATNPKVDSRAWKAAGLGKLWVIISDYQPLDKKESYF